MESPGYDKRGVPLAHASSADITDMPNITTWGDSLTAGVGGGGGGYPAALASLSGYTVYNGGVSGDTSTQIKVRMLADTNKHTWSTIIWAGRNNYSNPTQVKADIAEMVAALTSAGNDNYIIMGVINGEYASEHSGQSGYTTITQLNNDLATLYGSRYIDIRTYLVSLYDSGIPQDVIDFDNDIVPSSLRTDNLHLTGAGYSAVAGKINENIALLKGSESVLTLGNLPQIFASPLAVGSETQNAGYFSKIGIGTTTPSALLSLKGTAATDLPTYGAEFLTDTDWTSTGWTGDFVTGWVHTTGNTSVLSYPTVAVNGTKYQIAYTVTGRTAGSFTVAFGGQSQASISATGAFGPTTTSTANLTITPTTDFDGTIVISIKAITGVSSPISTYATSDDTSRLEIRANAGSNNSFIGLYAGRYTTTGVFNSAVGVNALLNNTTGGSNSAVGVSALFNNTTGIQNSAVGISALTNNTTGGSNSAVGVNALLNNTTGGSNSAVGVNALFSNTTGNYNSAVGYIAGRFLADATANQTPNSSLFLGYDTRASVAGGTNEIVIGASAIGNGSNTVTLGSSATLRTYLAGINLKAGSASAGTAPFKFTTGTLLTTAEAGAMEYNNTPWFTNSDAVRRAIVLSDATYTAGAVAVGGTVKMRINGTDYNVHVS